MADVIVTGASRGIGRALVGALAGRGARLVLVARDEGRLGEAAKEVERRGGRALVVPGDLGSVAGSRALGERLVGEVEPGATLVHNAGLWPARCERTAEGLEASFVVNYLGPLALQAPLLEAGSLGRVMVVSAGLIAAGRLDPEATPTGGDFSPLRTYANTKLCLAVASRRLAAAHPGVDWLVLHPGVVRTDLGARPGALGVLLGWVKRRWETPEVCAARLARLLGWGRWSPPGDARWFFEEQEKPWPAAAEAPGVSEALRRIEARYLPAV